MSATNSNPHSRIYRFVLWFGAISIIALGVYLTLIRFMGNEWLTRAGCLVVMLGLWSGIGGVLQERVLYTRLKWRQRNAITVAKARICEENGDSDDAEEKLAEINEAFEKQISDAMHKIRVSIGMLEVSLLLAGTFLWGFGDLLIR